MNGSGTRQPTSCVSKRETCEDDNYTAGDVCKPCPHPCTSCEEYDRCTACQSGLYFQEGRCVERCDDSFLPQHIPPVVATRLNSGRLEVYEQGKWATVCVDGFSESAAHVACVELGFRDVKKLFSKPKTTTPGQAWLSGIHCYGNETSLRACSHMDFKADCHQPRDIYIECRGELPEKKCVRKCDGGFFAENNARCVACNSPCLSCDGEGCTSCKAGLYLSGGVCVEDCGEGKRVVSGTCRPCNPKCRQCLDGPNDICTVCNDGKKLFNGTCVSQCPGTTNRLRTLTKLNPIGKPNEFTIQFTLRRRGWGDIWRHICYTPLESPQNHQLVAAAVCKAHGYNGLDEFFPYRTGDGIYDYYNTRAEPARLACLGGFDLDLCQHFKMHLSSDCQDYDELLGIKCAGRRRATTDVERCVETCPGQMTVQIDECVHCDYIGCLSCSTVKGNCTSCRPEWALHEGQCIPAFDCPKKTTWLNNEAHTCVPCESNCEACDKSGCNKCSQGYKLEGKSCRIDCQDSFSGCLACSEKDNCAECRPGYYLHGTKCVPCGPNCLKCDANRCLECNRTRVLFKGLCFAECPGNLVRVGVVEPLSHLRIEGVQYQGDINGTVKIRHGERWLGLCGSDFTNLASGEYEAICRGLGYETGEKHIATLVTSARPTAVWAWKRTWFCAGKEDPTCKVTTKICSGGELQVRCTGPAEGRCVEKCPEGFFRAHPSNTTCSRCSSFCKTCSSFAVCTSCRSPEHLSNGSCMACNSNCATCRGPLGRDKCTSCFERSFNNILNEHSHTCVNTCPRSLSRVPAGGWRAFAQQEKRLLGLPDAIIERQSVCVEHCNGSFFRTGGECIQKWTCQEFSEDLNGCTSCRPGTFLVANSSHCVSDCPEGFYWNTDFRKCMKCSEECQGCYPGKKNNTCRACRVDRGLYLDTGGGPCTKICQWRSWKKLNIVDLRAPQDDGLICVTDNCSNATSYYALQSAIGSARVAFAFCEGSVDEMTAIQLCRIKGFDRGKLVHAGEVPLAANRSSRAGFVAWMRCPMNYVHDTSYCDAEFDTATPACRAAYLACEIPTGQCLPFCDNTEDYYIVKYGDESVCEPCQYGTIDFNGFRDCIGKVIFWIYSTCSKFLLLKPTFSVCCVAHGVRR